MFDVRAFGTDTITDFARGDLIDISALHIGSFDQLQRYLGDNGGSATFSAGFDNTAEQITLSGFARSALKANMFAFDTTGDPLVLNGDDFYGDLLFGALGDDQLRGLRGEDTIDGGGGTDRLVGGFDNDRLIGGADADFFVFDARAFGTDTIADFSAGDRIDLRGLHIGDFAQLQAYLGETNGSATFTAGFNNTAEKIVITGVARAALTASMFVFDTTGDPLVLNGDDFYGDILFGALGNDQLRGLRGHDTLDGGGGNDILTGGGDGDTLIGGAGADRFRIGSGDSASTDRDSILDFSRAQGDKIDLRTIDPSTDFNDQKLTFVSGAFTATAQVSVGQENDHWVVSVNTDDNFATAEVQFIVEATRAPTAIDFLL